MFEMESLMIHNDNENNGTNDKSQWDGESKIESNGSDEKMRQFITLYRTQVLCSASWASGGKWQMLSPSCCSGKILFHSSELKAPFTASM